MSTATHYSILGLAQDASDGQVKKAYRTLVLLHHPDKTRELSPAEQAEHASKFLAIQEAYEVLTDLTRKASYDLQLRARARRPTQPSTRTSTKPSFSRTKPASSGGTTSPGSHKCAPNGASSATPEQDIPREQATDSLLASILAMKKTMHGSLARLDKAGLVQEEKIWKEKAERAKADVFMSGLCQQMREDCTRRLSAMDSKQEKPKTSPEQANNRTQQRKEERMAAMAAEAEKQAKLRQARQEDRSRYEARKKAEQELKNNVYKKTKEEQMARAAKAAKDMQERIARARAKAAPTAKQTPSPESATAAEDETSASSPGAAKKPCPRCGAHHASIVEVKRCYRRSLDSEDSDPSALFAGLSFDDHTNELHTIETEHEASGSCPTCGGDHRSLAEYKICGLRAKRSES